MNKCTIVCITYNQEKFIGKALESFVNQITTFPFKVIVSDDHSTDNTRLIIKEYAEKYPKIIEPIYRKKNLGVWKNYVDTLSRVNSEYVIVNEGDDYFCDNNKLQEQVSFLDNNPDYSICFHKVLAKFEDDNRPEISFPKGELYNYKKDFDLDDLAKENFIQTNSALYRWRFNGTENIREYIPRDILPLDYYVHLLHAQVGKIRMLEKEMSVYRINKNGIWYGVIAGHSIFYKKNGVKIIGFYYNVYKNIVKNSKYYYKDILLFNSVNIFKILLNCKANSELAELLVKYPSVFIDSLNIYNNTNQLNLKKLKKYKKLFRICLYFSIILIIILFVSLFFIMPMIL